MRILVVVGIVAWVASVGASAGAGEGLLTPGRVVLVGEQHGTEESPAFVLDLARRAARKRLPLVVGVEFQTSEQARMETFLDSPGGPADRAALLSGAPWIAKQQYGLTSEAMYRLIDGLRRLREKGRPIDIVPFDQPADGGSQARDRRMAAFLAERVETDGDAVVLVLTGNIHSRLVRGTPWDDHFQPMGMLLAGSIADPTRVVALDVAHRGGSAWLCVGRPDGTAPECGPREMAARGPRGNGISLQDTPLENGHLGWYHLGPIRASPPAAASSDSTAARREAR